MDAIQLNVKLYVHDDDGVDMEALIPVFHGWIRERKLEGEVMIDVADYSHVPEGPGVLLVCHEAHYGMDELDGRKGLLYSRKRGESEGDLDTRLTLALRKALAAAKLLEDDPDVGGAVKFRGNELTVRILNRLLAPNDDATLSAVRPALDRVVGRLYDGAAFTVERIGTNRQAFAVRIASDASPDVATMLERLAA